MRIPALFILLFALPVFAQTTSTTTPSTTSTTTSPTATTSSSTTSTTSPETSTETSSGTTKTNKGSTTTSSEPSVKAATGEEPKLPPKTTEASAPPAADQTGEATKDQPQTPETLSPEKKESLKVLSQERTIEPPQTASEVPESPGDTASLLETHISLDLRDIDVSDVLKYLAIKANLNLVGGSGIAGNVNLLLNDVSLKDAIDIILSTNRLAYTIKGNIMRVMTEEEYKALYGKEFYDKRETKIIRLQYASAKNVGAMLEHAKSAIGRVVYDDSTGTVVITDTPEKIAEMEEIIRHEELPTIVRLPPTVSEVFDLHYAKADNISEKLVDSLTKDLGKIYVDERANRLIVSDLPYKIEEMRNLVSAFDTKTREVYIEAKIVQVVLNDRFQGGIDWASAALGNFQQTFPLNLSSFGQMTLGSIAPETTTNADGTTSTSFSGSGIIMKFLETYGKTNILSTPQIAALDGQEAKIMVGSKEAYTTSSVTQSQATTTTAQQVTFVDVGITLYVTPNISANGFITMKIKPEVSSVTRFLTTSQGDQIPIVESTNAETTVMVKDGATVLIGGLMATRRQKTRSGMPILSRIPILGIFFRSSDDHASNSELSVLLTPHIMTGEETFPGARPLPIAQVTLPIAAGITEESTVTALSKEEIPETKAKTKRRTKHRLLE
ncbi:MAG: hypothetical protein HY541_07255 [Deltaproteobacteria bacterium]|nr:hypothetical protein [Deltaproteobacteria bacterium]